MQQKHLKRAYHFLKLWGKEVEQGRPILTRWRYDYNYRMNLYLSKKTVEDIEFLADKESVPNQVKPERRDEIWKIRQFGQKRRVATQMPGGSDTNYRVYAPRGTASTASSSQRPAVGDHRQTAEI